MLKYRTVVLSILSLKIEEACSIVQSEFFWLEFMLSFSKIRLFSSKKWLFQNICFKFARMRHLKLQQYSSQAVKKQLVALRLGLIYFWNYSFCQIFANLNSTIVQKTICFLLTNENILYSIDLFHNLSNNCVFC